MSRIGIGTTDLDGVVVATLIGRLELATHGALRDGLLKCAADVPTALVVRLGADFQVESRSMLAVFSTVWMRISEWPDIPLVLVAETDRHRHDLRRGGITRCVPTTDDLASALEATSKPPRHRYRRIALPGSSHAPGLAREAVRDTCERWGLPAMTGDAVMVASELVENAVRHAHSEPLLRIELRPRTLSLAVHDRDPTAPPRPEGHPAPSGLQLVDLVSRGWGHLPSPDGGKIVWAVLELRGDE
ncbi:ATP-binding protein [Lentzea alba]|uniref:ATP-binding protein n=1 Tax=Lentzea alba TaxID=2714351 RepID=UPI0039BFDCDF